MQKGYMHLECFSQEPSIIAARERMKMIEFLKQENFLLPVFTAALNHATPCAVKRVPIVVLCFQQDPHPSNAMKSVKGGDLRWR
jgi:hypothetical protein